MQENRQGKNQKKLLGKIVTLNKQVYIGAATMLAIAVLLIVGLYPRSASAPDAASTLSPDANAAGAVPATKVESGCALVQEMTYSRCGHEVTRRTQMPEELTGKARQDVEAYYADWQVTEFLPRQVTMKQTFDLYCAQHVVLMPDETGILGVFENKYGDGMAFIQTLDTRLDAFPESIQEELRPGKGFDTLADLEQWLESVES